MLSRAYLISRHSFTATNRRRQLLRFYSSKPSDPQKPGRIVEKLATNSDQLVNAYNRMFEKRAPHAYKKYEEFKTGLWMFFSDTREFCSLKLQIGTSYTLQHLLVHKDLQLLRQYPKDFRRTGLTIFISVLPFTMYFILPLAFTFPRVLLSRHFWSEEQLAEFTRIEHAKRLQSSRDLMKLLVEKCSSIPDPVRREMVMQLMNKVKSGEFIEEVELLENVSLFQGLPLKLEALNYRHRRLVCRVCELPRRKSRMLQDLELLQLSDVALLREGIALLSDAELKACCLERGLYAEKCTRQEMLEFLSRWTSISSEIPENAMSLLAHLPVLISHQLSQNKELIKLYKGKRRKDDA